MSSSNITAQAQPTTAAAPSSPRTVDQARAAWITASRDAELDRWHELYDRVVPAPLTSMTTRERYDAGWAARDADERARYRELDACSLRNGAEPEAGQ